MRGLIGAWICVILFAGIVEAANVSGIVVGADGRPVADAEVTLAGQQVQTLEDGSFHFDGVGSGTYRLEVRLTGFQTIMRNVDLTENRDIRVRLVLYPVQRLAESVVVMADVPSALPGPGLSSGAEELHRRSGSDIGEFLQELRGGAAVRKGGTALDPVFRGFQRDQLRVVVDGMMEVEGACPNRMDPPVSHFSLTDLGRLELVKGPFSVRFGSTLGGVINLVRQDAAVMGGRGITGRVGTGYLSNTSRTTADLRVIAGTPEVGIEISGAVAEGDDYTDGAGNRVDGEFNRDSTTIGTSLRLSDGHRVSLRYHHVYLWDTEYPALPMDADYDETDIFSISWDWSPGTVFDRIRLSAFTGRVDHLMSNRNRPTVAMMLMETLADTRTRGMRVEGNLRLGSGRVQVGLDHKEKEKDGTRTRTMAMNPGMPMSDRIWPDAWRNETGIFAEWNESSGESVTLSGGIRIDRFRSDAREPMVMFTQLYGSDLMREDTALSLHAGMDVVLSERVHGALYLGQGVRAPDISERYLYLLPVGLDRYDYLGNPDLEREINRQLEGELVWHGDRMMIQLSVFYADLTDLISARIIDDVDPRSPGVSGVKRFENIPDAVRYGAELELNWVPQPEWIFSADMFWSRGRDRFRGEDLPETPPAELQLKARYTVERFSVRWTTRIVARQDDVSVSFAEPETAGFTTHTVAGEFRIGDIIILGEISNITDKAYAEHLTRRISGTGIRIAEPGRSFFVGCRYHF